MFAVCVAAVWGLVTLYRAPILKVRSVEVDGAKHFSRDEVIELAEVPGDATLIRFPGSAIRERLEADPWIETASISRDFPDKLRISITERATIGVVDAGGASLWVVSSDGYWLGERAKDSGSLITIRDVGDVRPDAGMRVREEHVRNAVEILARLSKKMRRKVASVSAPSVDETALKTSNDVEIFFGAATDVEAKERIAREIIAANEGVVYINVRVTDRPTWRGLEGQTQ